MTTKFAVLNPMTGLYTETATEQERDAVLAKVAWEFFLSQTHNAPYSVVTVNDDGSETWAAPSGAPLTSPAGFEALFAQWTEAQLSRQNTPNF